MTRKPTLICLLYAPLLLLSAPALGEAPVGVGKISDLDLDVFRHTVEVIGRGTPSVPSDRRTLSLEEALVIALENNLNLQIAQLDLEGVETTVPEARAFFDPVLNANAAAAGVQEDRRHEQRTRSNIYTTTGSVLQNLPTGGQLSVGGGYVRDQPAGGPVDKVGGFTIEARQPLLAGGRIYVARREITDAEYSVDIQRATLAAQVLQVTSFTKDRYYNAIRTTRQVEVTNDAIERDRQLLEASQALFDAGRVNKRDVYSAEISLGKDRGKLAANEARRESAQNLLRDVLGLPIDMQIEIADLEIPFRPVEIQLDNWIQSALETRPEVAEARTRIARAELNARVRENFVLPALDLVGSGNRAANTATYDWRGGLEFQIPFGNVGARSALSRARILQAREERFYVQLERDIELAVRSFAILLEASIDRLKADVAVLENARAKREIATVRFQLGLANNLDITDANDDVSAAESDLLDVVYDYASNLAFLESAIGRPI